MIFATHKVAAFVAVLSLAFALGMSAAMMVLLVRRRKHEARAGVRENQKLAASRLLMRALAGQGDATEMAAAPPGAKRAAVSHLLRLVRGEDRSRLLAIAEREGLFADALAALVLPRPARRIDAMRLLEQYASPDCIAGLQQCLEADPVLAVRLEAAAALARLGALPPVEDLIHALKLDERPATRLHAALFRSLAKRDAQQLDRLARLPRYVRLRPLLVEAMGWTDDLNMVPRLAWHAADADPEVRCAAIRAARHLGHPGTGRWIVPLLHDRVEAVQVHAAQACGQLRLKEGVAGLERLAAHPVWWVRTPARAALDVLRPGGTPNLSAVEQAK